MCAQQQRRERNKNSLRLDIHNRVHGRIVIDLLQKYIYHANARREIEQKVSCFLDRFLSSKKINEMKWHTSKVFIYFPTEVNVRERNNSQMGAEVSLILLSKLSQTKNARHFTCTSEDREQASERVFLPTTFKLFNIIEKCLFSKSHTLCIHTYVT